MHQSDPKLLLWAVSQAIRVYRELKEGRLSIGQPRTQQLPDLDAIAKLVLEDASASLVPALSAVETGGKSTAHSCSVFSHQLGAKIFLARLQLAKLFSR